ncbi:hypothetical protein KEM56_001185 [Ascosphaera pollenicola]|nr:hypothetical protein KEM56_001185 [Ascosphaera pollenicola]
MSSTQEAAFLAAVATAVPAAVTVMIAGEKETRKISIELVNTLKKIAQRLWGRVPKGTSAELPALFLIGKSARTVVDYPSRTARATRAWHPAVSTAPLKKRAVFEDHEAEVGTGWYKQDHLTTAVAEKAEEIRALNEKISESLYLNLEAINNVSDKERAEHDFHQAARLIRLRRENRQAAKQLKEALLYTASILNHTNLLIGTRRHADFFEITDSARNEQEQEAQRAQRDSARLREKKQEEENLRHKPVARNLFGTISKAEDIEAQQEKQ